MRALGKSRAVRNSWLRSPKTEREINPACFGPSQQMLGWIHRANLPKSNVLAKDLQLRWNFWPSSWCSCFGFLGVVYLKKCTKAHIKRVYIHLKSPRCCMMPQHVITEWKQIDSIHFVILLVRSEAGVLSTWWSPWLVSWHELGVDI